MSAGYLISFTKRRERGSTSGGSLKDSFMWGSFIIQIKEDFSVRVQRCCSQLPAGWMDGWMDGWMRDGSGASCSVWWFLFTRICWDFRILWGFQKEVRWSISFFGIFRIVLAILTPFFDDFFQDRSRFQDFIGYLEGFSGFYWIFDLAKWSIDYFRIFMAILTLFFDDFI